MRGYKKFISEDNDSPRRKREKGGDKYRAMREQIKVLEIRGKTLAEAMRIVEELG